MLELPVCAFSSQPSVVIGVSYLRSVLGPLNFENSHMPYTPYILYHVLYTIIGHLIFGNSQIPCTIYHILCIIYTIYHIRAPYFFKLPEAFVRSGML